MEKEPENAEKFQCELCDFECCKKSNYDKHILTQKHKNRTFSNNLEQKNAEKCQTFSCKNCNKKAVVNEKLKSDVPFVKEIRDEPNGAAAR